MADCQQPWESDAKLVEEILAGSVDHFNLLYEGLLFACLPFCAEAPPGPRRGRRRHARGLHDGFQGPRELPRRLEVAVWIFGITRNTVNRRFRKARPYLESIDAPSARQLAAESTPIDRAVDARRALERCVTVIEEDLTPLQRRIFHLKHLRRQSIRSIADALGKSEDAIKANLYRMRISISESTPGLEATLGA